MKRFLEPQERALKQDLLEKVDLYFRQRRKIDEITERIKNGPRCEHVGHIEENGKDYRFDECLDLSKNSEHSFWELASHEIAKFCKPCQERTGLVKERHRERLRLSGLMTSMKNAWRALWG